MSYLKFFKRLIPDNIIFFLKKRSILKKKYFGLNEIDKKIDQYLDYNNGYFVELGANDGISQSNTLFLERSKRWKGILIEPILSKFNQCKIVRGKDNKFYNCACVSYKFDVNEVEMIFSNLRSVTNHNKNLIDPKKHIKKEDLKFFQNHKKIKVEARTLNSILKDAEAPKLIDFLSLDTEGYENEVLNGIDYLEFNFKYILVETKNFNDTNKILTKNNYKCINQLSYHDYLFKFNDY